MTTARELPSLLVTAALLATTPAVAQDAFEIQVYDSETARAGEPGLEMHLNYFAEGTTTPSPEGEVPTNHLTHITFEPHIGVTDWWELGMYLQFALRPDGGLDSGGIKLRSKWRLVEPLGPFKLALNIELARVSKRYEADGWGGELRPIVDARFGPLYLSANPIVAFSFAGPDAWKPVLEPAFKASIDVVSPVALGLEEYSGFGVIGDWLPPSEQTHRLFAVIDVVAGVFAVNFGVGYGFVGPEKWIVKAVITLTPPAPAGAER